jgi:hypothetical protein
MGFRVVLSRWWRVLFTRDITSRITTTTQPSSFTTVCGGYRKPMVHVAGTDLSVEVSVCGTQSKLE